MKIKTSLLTQFGILAINLAVCAYYYQHLPSTVPTHWNIDSKPDAYGSKITDIVMGPGLILFGILLTWSLPKLSPKKFEMDRFEGTYGYSMVLMSLLFLFLNIMMLRAADGVPLNFGKYFMAAMFVFFALLGNVLGKVRRNFYMGIRTPWTLASEPVWDATHRLAGRIWFVGGIIGAVIALLGAQMPVTMTFLLAIAFYPVIASYFIYRRIG